MDQGGAATPKKGISRPVDYGISYEQVEALPVPMLSSIGEVDK
jgi:hypothetical protein